LIGDFSMFRNLVHAVLASLLFTPMLDAQGTVGSNWLNTWGGSGADVGSAIATDSAGNSYVAGYTSSFGAGGQDVLLVKYDPSGNLLWARTWGGSSDESANGVLVGGDGSVYVVGGTQSFGAGWYDVLILKFDSSGNLIWARTWGGGSYDVGHDLSLDTNGNLEIAAEAYGFCPGSCALLLTMSTSGDILATRAWKGPATYDAAYSLTVDANGNTILAGISWDYSVSPEHNTILILKYDSQGNLVWSRNWAGPGGDELWGTKTIRTDTQGNIYFAGRTTIVRGSSDFDVLLAKIDPNGNLLWAQKWGGTGYDTANALWLDPNNNIDLVGSTASVSGVQAALIQQYDQSGTLLISNALIPLLAVDPSEWTSISPGGIGTFVATGDVSGFGGAPGIGGLQDTGISSVAASGSLSAPSGTVNTPTGTVGSPNGTVSSPSGLVDYPGGGTDVLTASLFTGPGIPVIPGYPGYQVPPATSGSPQSNSTTGYSSEPVNTGTGNYYYQHTDIAIPGRGLPLVFQRGYNAQDTYSGPLGANWSHTYNVVLTQTATGVANIRFGDGHGETFTLSGTTYVPQPGAWSTLIANTDGTFTYTQKNHTQYTFSSTGQLTSVSDRNGNTIALLYDGSGNLTQINGTAGRSLVLAYDASNRIATFTDPMGRTVHYSYSANNDLASVTDQAGGVTQYAYDASHRVTSITQPNGATLLQNTYDAQGRVIAQANGRGYSWTFAYNTPGTGQTTITDARGANTIHSYDASLRLIRITDALDHTVSYEYDANNNRISVTNQNGNATNITYDANGNVTSITDPISNATSFTYGANNNLLTAAAPKGATTVFAYDANNNLATVQDASGNKTVFGYDVYGELISKTNAKSQKTTLSYNSFGDLASITNPLGNVISLAYDGVGLLVSITDANRHAASSTYDQLGRLISVLDPLGDKTQFSYDPVGNLLAITDANGHVTSYSYDSVNNLVAATDALGHVTRYGYDNDNNRVSFTNAKGNKTLYSYDSVNRLSTVTDPLSFTTSYSYDSVGNVVSVTDAKGDTNQFAYDALNRLLNISYADGKKVAYSYDANGNRSSMADSHGTTNYSYDALDRLIAIANPGGKTVGYSYDAVGNRASLSYPDGKSLNYTYDAANHLAQVIDWLGRGTNYSYDPASDLTKIQYPNGAAMGFNYDAANRLTQVLNIEKGIPPLSLVYSLDPVGNRTTINVNGIITNFAYDALSELVSAQLGSLAPTKTTWTYDAVGNRLQQASVLGKTNYSYDAADRLLTAGSRTFTYDANGNRVSVTDASTHQSQTLTYDAANRLTAATGTKNSSFSYDGDGNRVTQSVGSGTYNYVNDVAAGLPVELQESGPDGNITYAYGLCLIEEAAPTFNYFYQYDGLGSVIGLTDAKGALQGAYAYDAWGNTLLSATDVGTRNKLRYTGEALDPGTGLYFLRARYYDPSVGGFTTRDPLATINRYPYANNRPLSYTDPSGLWSLSSVANSLWQTSTLIDSSLLLSTVTYAQGPLQLGGTIASALGGGTVANVNSQVNNYIASVKQNLASNLVSSTANLENIPLSNQQASVIAGQVVSVTDFGSAIVSLLGAPSDLTDFGLKYIQNGGPAIIPVLGALENLGETVQSTVSAWQMLTPQTNVPSSSTGAGSPK
jgi:RHS repeat-associated protein